MMNDLESHLIERKGLFMAKQTFSILLVDEEEEVHSLLKSFLEIVFGDDFVLYSSYDGAELRCCPNHECPPAAD